MSNVTASTQPTGDTGAAALAPGRVRAFGSIVYPLLVLAIVLSLTAAATVNWDRWTAASATQVTDNAYVRAEMSRLATRVAGAISSVAVDDYQRVRAGDLLVRIDPADYVAQVAQAEASVASARAVLANLDNQFELQEATIAQADAARGAAQATLMQAEQEFRRQQSLTRSEYGTTQKLEQAQTSLSKAESDLAATEAARSAQRAQLAVLKGTKKQREAEVATAEASLSAAQLRLSYTEIRAPFDGVVGERQVQVGDYVGIGGALITVVPLPDVYVVANYKETQLTRVVPGQPVAIEVDGLPGERLSGTVERISPASGSQFALLPPDNATGNFTKVVQRLAVRIALDPGQDLATRLRPGMSVVTTIDVGKAMP
jgi:membrane fusion protein (multidrug efflux system)